MVKPIKPGPGTPDTFKVVLLGEARTGKSALLTRLMGEEGPLSKFYNATIGVEFGSAHFEGNVKLKMWDTAGNERFRNITASYMSGDIHVITLLLDGTKSADEQRTQLEAWVRLIAENLTKTSPPSLFIGYSQSDLATVEGSNYHPLSEDELRRVYAESRDRLGDQRGKMPAEPHFFSCSAATNKNVDTLLDRMIAVLPGRVVAPEVVPMDVEVPRPATITPKQRAAYAILFASGKERGEGAAWPAIRLAALLENYYQHSQGWLWRSVHPNRHHQVLARAMAQHLRANERMTIDAIRTYIVDQMRGVEFNVDGSFNRRIQFALDTLRDEEAAAAPAAAPALGSGGGGSGGQ